MDREIFKKPGFLLIGISLALLVMLFVVSSIFLRPTELTPIQSSPTPTQFPLPTIREKGINSNITQVNPAIRVLPDTQTISSGKPQTFIISFPKPVDPNLVSITLIRVLNEKPIDVPFSVVAEKNTLIVTMKEPVLPQTTYLLFLRERTRNKLFLSARYIGE